MTAKEKGGSAAKGKRKRGRVTSGDDSEAEEEDSEPESDFEEELMGISRKRQVGVYLTILHSEQPKLYGVLVVLSAIGLINRSAVAVTF